MNPSDTL